MYGPRRLYAANVTLDAGFNGWALVVNIPIGGRPSPIAVIGDGVIHRNYTPFNSPCLINEANQIREVTECPK